MPPSLARLPQQSLDAFVGQIETILLSLGAQLPQPWKQVSNAPLETLIFSYKNWPCHLYAGIVGPQLSFGVSYVTDAGMFESFTAPPDLAPVKAKLSIEAIFARDPATPFTASAPDQVPPS